MEYRIEGNPAYGHLSVRLGPGERFVAEGGSMAWMSEGVQVKARLHCGHREWFQYGYRLHTIRPSSGHSPKLVIIGERVKGCSVEESFWSENLNTPG
ncbi:MAG: AIM24 family protein [Chloroflexi bacterium]|nr:AIM24 family protein [Chloroflexota bacterium]